MSVRQELRFSVDIHTRDVGQLAELAAACGEAPKDYVVQSIQIDTPSEIRPYDPRKGAYVCTITATLVPWQHRDASAKIGGIAVNIGTNDLISQQLDNMTGEAWSTGIDSFLPQDGQAEAEAPADPHGANAMTGELAALIKEQQAGVKAAQSRAFQIETITDLLRKQDKMIADGGIGWRPFPDRMAFSEYLLSMSTTIRTMIPRPGNEEVPHYQDMLKQIAAHCIREMEQGRR